MYCYLNSPLRIVTNSEALLYIATFTSTYIGNLQRIKKALQYTATVISYWCDDGDLQQSFLILVTNGYSGEQLRRRLENLLIVTILHDSCQLGTTYLQVFCEFLPAVSIG